MTHRLAALLLLLAACSTAPQPKPKAPADAGLFAEIASMDRAMFDAFNAHDASKLETLFSPDLEFFHDKGGLATRDQVIGGLRGNFARNDGLRRRLIPGSLEVYPVPGYGAIESGMHEFCHEENGKTDCGVFRFLHVWQKHDGQWRVTRVVSYDH
ncbi:MAG TPA: nuclear transport factor 2 family protein [Thermoanaerobaculia bacterium]|nr:nuclear transport factor 2 family protein [Thermoanaerobaculia bacterium]